MNGAGLRRIGLTGLAALTVGLSACATAPGSEAALAPDAASDPVRRVALALAAADEAAASGDRERLARAVAVVDASGAGPLAEADSDPLPAWRALAGGAASPMRGSPLGPGYRRGTLAAGQSTEIEQLFLSGERAKIALSTPREAPLALKVHDARKGPVCEREGTPNDCQWVPVFTQRYSIVISNRGAGSVRYYLVIE